MPSEGTLRTVCEYLNLRRLLTTEVYVVGPTYKEVKIRVEVVAEDSADSAEVKREIEQSLLDYFHPLKGGEDGQGWKFGGNIFYSRVYQRVFSVPGVYSIDPLIIILEGKEYDQCKNIEIEEGVLVFSTEHDVQVNYSFDE